MDRYDRIAARLVMAAPAGASWTTREERLLGEGRIGHLILFRRNLRDPGPSRRFIARGRQLLPEPALVAVDHEGGIVVMAEAVAGVPPSAMQLGAGGDPAVVEAWAADQAVRLRRAGIDVNLAPVLDVAGPGGSRVIGTRAFGGRATLVGRLGAAAVRGYLRGGVLPVGKHFPGHGGVRADSHAELPVDRRSRSEIARRDIAPFRAAHRAGLGAVMIAHVAYPRLGTARRPATLSPDLIQGLLRGGLRFDGVVCSDALEMAGFPGERFIPEAFRAGIDLFCASRSISQGARIAGAIARVMRRGEIEEEHALASAARIEHWRLSLPVRPTGEAGDTLDPVWDRIVHLGRKPFRPPAGEWTVLLPDQLGGRLGRRIDRSVVEAALGTPARHRLLRLYPYDPSPQRLSAILEGIRGADTIVLGLLGRGELPEGQRRLFRTLRRRTERLVPVALLDPDPLLAFDLPDRLFTFDFRPATLAALFRILLGEERPGGRLPIARR